MNDNGRLWSTEGHIFYPFVNVGTSRCEFRSICKWIIHHGGPVIFLETMFVIKRMKLWWIAVIGPWRFIIFYARAHLELGRIEVFVFFFYTNYVDRRVHAVPALKMHWNIVENVWKILHHMYYVDRRVRAVLSRYIICTFLACNTLWKLYNFNAF